MTNEEKTMNAFPEIWKYSPPTIDKFIMQRLDALQRQNEQLKQEIYLLKKYKSFKIRFRKTKK